MKIEDLLEKTDPDTLFDLIEEIASGSFGTVYKGMHKASKQILAIKIIQPDEDESLEDLMIEIQVLKKCVHPNIVKYFGGYKKGEEIFIAMDLCDGGAVNDIFNVCEEPLTEDQIALISRETLKGLAYMHEQQIIHRDIKGGNVLLTSKGEVKLVDFGVSFQCANNKRAKTFIGTPYWMAPEVIESKTSMKPYDYKADVWSVGIMAIELAETNPPLSEIHPMKALFQIPIRESPKLQRPSKWSKEFNDFISKCLIKEPAKRPSCTEALKLPFVANCNASPAALIQLIEKRKNLERSQDMSTSDSKETISQEEDFENLIKEETLRAKESTKQAKASAAYIEEEDEDLEMMDGDDLTWLSSGTGESKPQVAPTLKKPVQMMASEDWANSDDEEEYEEEYEVEEEISDEDNSSDAFSGNDPFSAGISNFGKYVPNKKTTPTASSGNIEIDSRKDFETIGKNRLTPNTQSESVSTENAAKTYAKSSLARPSKKSTLKTTSPIGSGTSLASVPHSPRQTSTVPQTESINDIAAPIKTAKKTVKKTVKKTMKKTVKKTVKRPPNEGNQDIIINNINNTEDKPQPPTSGFTKATPQKFTKRPPANSSAPLNAGKSTMARPTGTTRRTVRNNNNNNNNAANRKLIRMHMKEMRAYQEKHKKVLEEKKTQIKNEEQQLTKNFQKTDLNLQKQNQTTTQNLSKTHKNEIDHTTKQNQRDIKNIAANHQKQRDQSQRDIREEQKANERVFFEKQATENATQVKFIKERVKKEKSLTKKQAKQIEEQRLKELQLKKEVEDMIFFHQQAQQKQNSDTSLQLKHLEELHSNEREQLQQMHKTELTHMQQLHTQQMDSQKLIHQNSLELNRALHPTEIRNFQQEQDILYQNLLEIQQVEFQQQAKSRDLDERKIRKEFETKQKDEKTQFEKQLQALSKQISNKDALKQERLRRKDEFTKLQLEQKNVLDNQITTNRKKDEEYLHEAYAWCITAFKEERFKQFEKLLEQQHQQQADLMKKLHNESFLLFKQQQQDHMELLQRQQKQQQELQQKHHEEKKKLCEQLAAETITLYEQQHRARRDLLIRQHSQISLLTIERTKQTNALEKSLAEQKTLIQAQVEKERLQLEQEIEYQKQKLDDFQKTTKHNLVIDHQLQTTQLAMNHLNEKNGLEQDQKREFVSQRETETRKLDIKITLKNP
eukprot:TRINITY_DN35_c0_g2_i1.p1 TRINITY_DN35_c0_g2~~TRINITY_DN35_c0_g2_i1.p1  ORF type:complete len:1183 (-),score=602.26 TRINITY_DN35_c0_g2_i1:62-3610(-)